MGIFNEFNKKEKPVFTGFHFGFGRGSTASTGDDAGGGDLSLSGGNVEYTLGNNKIHVFTSPGTLSNSSGSQIVAEYVLIAGGGGSAGDAGGGGGAGGVVSSIPGIMPVTRTPLTMNNGQSVTVTIGAGGPASGAGQPNSPAYPGGRAGGNGEDTLFAGPAGNSVRALGGGGGGQEGNTGPSNLPVNTSSGGRGGSGGGSRGGRPESNNSNGLDNQGNSGSEAVAPRSGVPGIGGGGGGGAGGAASSTVDGGVGIQLPPAFRDNTQPTAVKGDPGTYGGLPSAPTPGGWWFAGGGGGYTDSNYPIPGPAGGTYGQGGSGGGGKGANPPEPISPQPGQANTGGGAGGQGSGGSGIAFFLYPKLG